MVGTCGIVGNGYRCPQVHKLAAGAAHAACFGVIARVSLGIIIGKPVRPMKDRQAPVRVFMHAHRGTHEMRPERARRDLQAQAAPLDGIIVPHPALLLDAQNVLHSAAAIADEGAAGLDRGDREGGIVGRPIALGEPAIGRCDRRDAGQRQLLRRPVLQGAEGALATAAAGE